jgi:hypothetical protein
MRGIVVNVISERLSGSFTRTQTGTSPPLPGISSSWFFLEE